MYLLRVQAIIDNNPLLYKRVSVFSVDGVTLVPLFDPITEAAIGNSFNTDASGFIQFKVASLQSLSFRQLIGLTLSTAYPLFNSSNPVPQPPELSETLVVTCGETIIEGRAVRIQAGLAMLVDATNVTHANTIVGVARQSGNIGESITLVNEDYITNTAWTFLEAKPVFVGAAGVLTQNVIGLTFIQQVGVAASPTKLALRISQPFIRL